MFAPTSSAATSQRLPSGKTDESAALMSEKLAAQLVKHTPGGYHSGSPIASEPTAWAAMALAAGHRQAEARRACQWLQKCQSRDGSVGVSLKQSTPAWPTGLAILAWSRWDDLAGTSSYSKPRARAIDWALQSEGRTVERKPQIGHDTTLVGWSWAAKTHSWLEPSAIFVRALTETGNHDHPRTQEGVRLIVDRLLPTGGANYGNTRVLQQYLLPHPQPTGLALWALAGHGVADPRIEASLDYLNKQLAEPMGVPSLAYALMGLAAWGQRPANSVELLREAVNRQQAPSCYKLALLTLAAQAMALLETED